MRRASIKQGIEQGIDRGRAELLLKQLHLKFGDIGELAASGSSAHRERSSSGGPSAS